MTNAFRSFGFLLTVVTGLTPTISAQSSVLSDTADQRALYHFVRSAAYVSRRSAELDQKNGTGRSLRNAFSQTVGLNDKDSSDVFAVATELDAQLASVAAQAAAVIASAKRTRTTDGLIPPPPAELLTLQQRKIALISTLSQTITARLSSSAAAAVSAYLRRGKATSQPPGNLVGAGSN